MLVELTPNLVEIERRKQIALENNFEYEPQTDKEWIQEKGIYQSSFAFNFENDVFIEKLDGWNLNKDLFTTPLPKNFNKLYKEQYGVADNIEQIKEFYKKQIKDKKNKYVIALTPVYQDLENKGKGGGWRWHKWGKYIGALNPQCEYLDDEEFGDDFKYVICFHLYKVK